ncbi:MAG TPA: hypothetical protein VNJ02_05005 [Vicinamibacterales bacterium]|nr:hypothetical protein [Vicinamibacterales bacterium]
MRILFSALHFGFFRNFESVVERLAERGHEVILSADEPEGLGGLGLVERLAARHATVRVVWTPSCEQEPWFRVARKLRHGLDYLRFLEPQYTPFPKLRERARERAPRAIDALMHTPGLNTRGGRRVVRGWLDLLDRSMPSHTAMEGFLQELRPDVALFASVTNPRAPQFDHLRAARKLGIPTGVCIYSWDHLSSKTLIRIVPDRVLVWNEVQKHEAVTLHQVPAARVTVTGAQVYDQWFSRSATRSREQFVEAIGLPGDVPLLLYVCSAMTPDPHESSFVREWLGALRSAPDPKLRTAAVLIRPHPERRAEWDAQEWSAYAPLVIAGQNPVTDTAKADYFDALLHADAVIGLVTSAFLEAAIAGRPVLTVMPKQFASHQEGMLHFRYLLEVEDGLLLASRTLDDHVAHLGGILAGQIEYRERQSRFLRAFVRPGGLEVPATAAFVDAVERLPLDAQGPRVATAPVPAGLTRQFIKASDTGFLASVMLDSRELGERRSRDGRVDQHRQQRRSKWRTHRRKKLIAQVQFKLQRVRDLIR